MWRGEIELGLILQQIGRSHFSFQRVVGFLVEAKRNFLSIEDSGEKVRKMMLSIFKIGIERVDDFFDRWLDKKIQPTDEELDLLKEGFSEVSWAFDFFSSEDNEKWQNKIKENKKIISEEKDKREKIKGLQSQINSLQNQQSNNIDNEAEIKDLQRKIDELKNRPLSSNPSKPQIPQQPTPSLLKGNGFLIVGICLGLGVCLILVITFWYLKKIRGI